MPGTRVREARAKRLDIQGLRALAVTLVVLYHIWPTRVPGGFVGVDVFFVISGFLITSHILGEVDRTGTVSLTRFWARRIRRLLPASFLVLAACVVLAFRVLPSSVLQQNLSDIAAAAGYVVNWTLAFDAVDYLASENSASLVQHYWSLSTEEQFYIVWPVLIAAATFLAARLFRTRATLVIGITLAVVFAASLAYSVIETNSNPSFAYFITMTRAWEFAAGGLIAMLPALGDRGSVLRLGKHLASWAAVVLIVASGLLLDGSLPFPGWLALFPVAGTAFLLWTTDSHSPWSPQFLTHARPVQLIGDTSYSIYLWHWPLIVIAPVLTGSAIGLWGGVLIGLTAIGLAIATKYLVEDPVRNARGTLRQRWPAYAFTAAGMVILISIAPVTNVVVTNQEAGQATLASAVGDAGCLGAAALDPTKDCKRSSGEFLVPTVAKAHDDAVSSCMSGNEDPTLRVCDRGVDPAEATTTVAIAGDSHAAHFLPALEEIARQKNWHIVTLLKGSCPFTDAVRDSSEALASSCTAWNASARQAVAEHPEISMVFTSASSMNPFVADAGKTASQTAIDGYVTAWAELPASVERVVVLRDVPRPRPDNLDCLGLLRTVKAQLQYGACSTPRDDALLTDPAALAAQESPRATLVDLSDLMCDDEQCLVVTGNVVVYRDGHHITATFSRSLAPYILERMQPDSPH